MIAGQARGGKGGSELVAESDGIREEVTERPLFVTWATRRISVASRPDAHKDMCRAPHNVLLTTRNSPLFVARSAPSLSTRLERAYSHRSVRVLARLKHALTTRTT